MKVNKNQGGNVAIYIVLIVVGLGIGFAIGRVMNSNKTTSSDSSSSVASAPDASTKAADLRSDLVTLGVEHQALTDQAVDAALDGSPEASAVGAALYANGNTIGAAVGSVYGKSAETTFDAVWKLHLDQFVAYATADASGDQAGKTAALTSIENNYTKPLSMFLAKANPNLPEATLEKVLGDHVTQTAQVIDDHVQKNYTQEQTDNTAADTHIEAIFSVLAGGIVKQYPAKF